MQLISILAKCITKSKHIFVLDKHVHYTHVSCFINTLSRNKCIFDKHYKNNEYLVIYNLLRTGRGFQTGLQPYVLSCEYLHVIILANDN